MNEETRADFLVRSRIVAAIRRHLDADGFVEVETPVLQPRYGGAFAHPFVTHYNELDADFYLRIATELYLKRLIVGGLERVYEIGKDFRNEGVSYKHQPEFTMLEWYEAYADYRDTMERMERLLEAVALEVHRDDEDDVPRARARSQDAVAAASLHRRAGGARPLDPRRGRAAGGAERARRRDERGQGLGSADRPRVQLLRRADADRADDRARLPDRDLALRALDRRRRDADRALRVLRRRDGARERVLGDQRLRRSSSSASCTSPSRSRGRRRIPTTSRRSPTGCRRPAGSGSASTGSRCCSRAGTRSAT